MSSTDAPSASQALLIAALSGLLCVSTYACSEVVPSLEAEPDSGLTSSAGGSSGQLASPARDAAAELDASPRPGDASLVDAGPSPVDANQVQGPLGCDGGVAADPHVTASSFVPSYPLEQFTADCTERGGTLQLQPHCGGLNGCRGMSYDTGTQTLTENTCRGTNTCAGYSCIDCDD